MNNFFSMAIRALKEQSPRILTGLGIVLGAGCAVSTAVETYKHFDEVIEQHNKDITEVKEEQDGSAKRLGMVYLKTAGRFIRTYACPLALGGLSATCVIASNGILQGRNNALTTTLASTLAGYAAYRKTVIDRFGKDTDEQLSLGLVPVEIEEVDENGEIVKKTIMKETRTPDEVMSNPCRFWFSPETSKKCIGDPASDLYFLQTQEALANKLLRRNRDVGIFENEILETLGLPKTLEGQFLGWVRTRHEDTQVGDPYISFGLRNYDDPGLRAFMSGSEQGVWIEFNCTDVVNRFYKKYIKDKYGELRSAYLKS